MYRRALFVLLAMLLTAGQLSLAHAQDETPPRPNPLGRSPDDVVDLAALILNPDDFNDPGYGLDDGRYTSIQDDAAGLVSLMGGTAADEAEMVSTLREAGWQGRYFNLIALPDEDPSLYAISVFSMLTLYEDEAGAETGFTVVTEANDALGMTALRGGEPVGDDAVFTRYRNRGDDFENQQVDVVFRIGRFVAEINIADWTGPRPDVAMLNDLAAVWVERLEAPEAAAGGMLAPRNLLVTGSGVETQYAVYQRLDGDHLPFFNQSDSDVSGDDDFFDDAGVVDLYMSRQTAPMPGDDADDYLDLYTYLYHFEDANAAERTMEAWPADYIATPPDGFSDVTEVRRATEFGDASATLSYTWAREEDAGAPGHRIYVLIDDVIIIVVADALAGVPLEPLEEITAAAVACMGDGGACAPIRLPRELR